MPRSSTSRGGLRGFARPLRCVRSRRRLPPEFVFLLQLVVSGVAIGGVYGLVALGFVLIYKATDVLNLAQGEMLMLGAYVSYDMLTRYGLPFPLALVATLAFS